MPLLGIFVARVPVSILGSCHQLKYGKLPTKLAITNPWEALCVDLIGPHTLKGKDKTLIDFMCVTMIDPATSWFEIVELPISQHKLDIPKGTKEHKGKDKHIQAKQPYFDKTSLYSRKTSEQDLV